MKRFALLLVTCLPAFGATQSVQVPDNLLFAPGDLLTWVGQYWTNLARGTEGHVLSVSGTGLAWVAPTGGGGGGTGTVTSVAASSTVTGLSFSGSPITTMGTLTLSGTVGEAAIDAAIARDSEVSAGYQPLDADLTDLADGSLTGSKVGSGIDAGNITSGTVGTARLGSGTANSGVFLRGDQTWAAPPGGGGGSNFITSVSPDFEVTAGLLALTNTTGTGTVKRTRTGVVRAVEFPANRFLGEATEPASAATNTFAATTDRAALLTWGFSGSNTNGIQAGFVFPPTWDGGAINARIYWKPIATESNTTNVYSVAVGGLGDGATGGTVLGTAVQVQDQTLGSTNAMHISSWSANITAGGSPAPGDFGMLSIRRLPGHASDNGGSSRLFHVLLEMTESETEPADN